MVTATAMIMTITIIIMIMIRAELRRVPGERRNVGALPLPICGRGSGEGVTDEIEGAKPLIRPVAAYERKQTAPATHESPQ